MFSIIDVVRWGLCIVLSIAIGDAMRHWGIGAQISGYVIGAGIGIAVWKALGAGIDAYYRRHPLRPPCKQGRCLKDSDYTVLGIADDGVTFLCRCGDHYILTKDKRFQLLDAKGHAIPYMKKCSDGWQPELLEHAH